MVAAVAGGIFPALAGEAMLAVGRDVRLVVSPGREPADSTRPAYTRLAPRASTVGRRTLPLAGAHAPAAQTLAVGARRRTPPQNGGRVCGPREHPAPAARAAAAPTSSPLPPLEPPPALS